MSGNQQNTEKQADDGFEPRPVKAEGVLPLKAAGIESLKEANPEVMSPHRNIFRWFARRPTAATRLAILSSVLPKETSNDELLKLMGVGPRRNLDSSIEDYVVEKYATKDSRTGSVTEHFGYDYPHRTVPDNDRMSQLQEELKEFWDGSLPTVLDPTAGGGTIPLEAARYDLPTISNELNPVAWLLNKTILDFAQNVGSLEGELDKWMSEIESYVASQLADFFPKKGGVAPNHYFRAYSISCLSCGETVPISNTWWFNRRRGIAVRPKYEDGDDLRYEIVNVPDEVPKSEFDPGEGTVSGGDIECPHCGVVTERDDAVEIFAKGEFDYEVCAVRYEADIGETEYYPADDNEREAIQKAEEELDSDLRLATLLDQDRYIGYYDRSAPYGIKQWRDIFSPRQLLSHATYLEAFENIKPDVKEEYEQEKAEAILTLLSFISIKLVDRNTRLVPIDASYGCTNQMLGNNNFSFQWHFAETNMMAGTYSYQTEAKNVIENYEEVVSYLSHLEENKTTIRQGDAADLPLDDSSIEAVVIDPPYGDNVMYAEISDAFYVWFREYLGDVFPEAFRPQSTNKEDEAVENPVIVSETEDSSTSELARARYENKMRDIFAESHRVLEEGGVLTIYFTDKEVQAWDSLTMSIIEAGFLITATHTITSEMPQRIGVKEDASADSTLLLTCRKPASSPDERTPTLWSDIREETRQVARENATELLSEDYNFTKTDMIISSFGPTLRVFTEVYPVVDKHDEVVRPKQALEEARKAVTEVLVERELDGSLDEVDSLSKWYVLSWLVYGREDIPYDEARQLGIGVGVQIDEIKTETKIWGKSRDTLLLKGQDYRVRDYSALEAGEKRRKRAYPIDPRDTSFVNDVDAVHAALNVLETKGGDFAWNWIQDRGLQEHPAFKKTIKSLIQVLPENHDDYELLINLVSGETGELLDVDIDAVMKQENSQSDYKTTLGDF
jgi:adenine-specific DNA methylase